MAKFKKPQDTQFLHALTIAAIQAGEEIKKDRKSPINHVKIILESYGLFNYPAIEAGGDVLRDQMTEFLNIIPFSGNKLLKTGIEKDIEWYEAHLDLLKAINEFV